MEITTMEMLTIAQAASGRAIAVIAAQALFGRSILGAVLADGPSIEALRTRQQDLQAASEALFSASDEAGRELTDDELAQIEGNAIEGERLTRRHGRFGPVVPRIAGFAEHRVGHRNRRVHQLGVQHPLHL